MHHGVCTPYTILWNCTTVGEFCLVTDHRTRPENIRDSAASVILMTSSWTPLITVVAILLSRDRPFDARVLRFWTSRQLMSKNYIFTMSIYFTFCPRILILFFASGRYFVIHLRTPRDQGGRPISHISATVQHTVIKCYKLIYFIRYSHPHFVGFWWSITSGLPFWVIPLK